jgi:hypothetical protein
LPPKRKRKGRKDAEPPGGIFNAVSFHVFVALRALRFIIETGQAATTISLYFTPVKKRKVGEKSDFTLLPTKNYYFLNNKKAMV